ncbi:MAG: M24 family metallopeptidase [Alphaproteobacteria bacterium]|nr:M24 family metallopeptidase [Alphaproteobacteria bacterium]
MNESSPAKSVCRMNYQGDDALKTLLAKNGSTRSPAEIRALVAGILAAPPALDTRAWHALVAAAPSDALAAQLDALAAEMAAARDGDRTHGKSARERIDALRAELAARKLAGFVLPRGDEHQGEYVSPRAERLLWLTGFTGSAGACIVLADKAAMFVDGRYTLQVKTQVDGKLFAYRHLVDEPPHEWLAENAPRGGRIGYDPWLHSSDSADRMRLACEKAGAELVALSDNPVDAVWQDQPPPPISPARPHPLEFAGKSMHEKRAELAARLKRDGLDAAVISAPDSLAWLLNIRGGDVPHTPLALGFAVVRADGNRPLELYMDERKLLPETKIHLGNSVEVRPPAALGSGLEFLGKAKARVLTDRLTAAAWIDQRLAGTGAVLVRDVCPCALPKACKNERELAGARAAHVRDGAALVRFLAWLSREAPTGKWDEIAVSDKLMEFRRAGGDLRDTSFDTISGAGPNGAIVHYRSTPATSRRLEPDMLFLLDSGAQYPDGTTDVTRTMAVGKASEEQKDRFTRVLKGHIAIARARFPKGTSGSQLDTLARRALWDVGLDYDHGTGHGVGSYLSVHEGPHRISKMPNSVALQPGMIVSNEPGYYKTGAYGIRIENLVAVREADPIPGAERPMLGFETLTLAPIDRHLVARDLLDAGERDWLDAYHARVLAEIGPLVDEQTRGWLEAATARI